jgi:hypothetical protein
MADRYWVLGGTGVWSSTTNWSTSSGGASGASVPGSADNVIFDRASTYTVSITTGSSCLSFTASAGSPTFTMTNTLSIGGNFNLTGSTTTWTASTSGLFFQNQAGGGATRTINSAGVLIDCPVTVSDNVASTVQLAANFTIGSTRTFTFGAGIAGDTLDLNGFTLTCGIFNSSNAITRTLAFGTGKIVCTATGTPWNLTTITGLTVTGTPRVELSYSGSTAMTVQLGSLSQANSISFWFQAGSYSLSFGGTTIRNLDFTGSATTVTSATLTIYGNLTLSSTTWSVNNAQTFAATSGTQIITSNAQTMDFPLTFNGVGGTFKLADALTMGPTRALLIQNGTLDGNNKTISGAASFSSTLGGGTPFIKNISTALSFTISTGALTQSGPNTFGAFTFSGGTLNLASYTLTCNAFSAASGSRTLAFGTGKIVCVGPPNAGAPGALFTFNSPSGTVTGTAVVDISYSGATAGSVYGGTASAGETQAISFNITTGTYPLTIMPGNSLSKSVNFTGFAGTFIASLAGSSSIYGDLTLSTGMTMPSNTNPTLAFQSTSTQTITSNGKTIDLPILVNGVGGNVILADALLMGTARPFNLTNGTLDLNGKTLTVGTQFLTGAGTQNLTFNGGTLVCPAATTTAFNNGNPTNFTTTAGTGIGKISMTGATAKTFVGGGSTFNCTLSNDGAGTLTVSGSNTFTTIANGVQPTAFTFTAGTTQTVTNWSVSGTAGNLVTIISSTAGVPALLSKASGTVSSNYLSLKDSTATGGAAWYAGANSTNVSGNLGWIFTAPPATSTGSFFFMF